MIAPVMIEIDKIKRTLVIVDMANWREAVIEPRRVTFQNGK